MHNLIEIKESLKHLGIHKGDTVFLRAALKSIGKVDDVANFDLIKLLLEMVGEEGTLVSLAFTSSFFIKKPDKKYIFTELTPSYAGAVPNLMLKHPDAKRSAHPTNSVVAIGKYAEYITSEHDDSSKPYDPIQKLIELNANMVLIGCAKSSPGFTTVHYAEQELGILKKILFTRLNRVYYEKDGEIKLYIRDIQGACSNGFYKFYSNYVNEQKLLTTSIGNAYSISIRAKDAYEIEKEILSKNSCFALCDNLNCFMCRGRRLDNFKSFPLFYAKLFIRLIGKGIRKIRENK